LAKTLDDPQKIDVLLEPSCGYGAFFNTDFGNSQTRYIGADIDANAINVAKIDFPHIEFLVRNSLHNVKRSNYNISDGESVIIVGNPPFNDKTSHVKNALKMENIFEIDQDLQTRDLGLSNILAYAKLNPDFVAIIHPLSYLIKKANFKILLPFLSKYKLINSLVFNSQEFPETSKLTGFPVVIAIYKKDKNGTAYEDIFNCHFATFEGDKFSLSQFDYISNYVYKYPSKFKNSNFNGYLFYTLRDINALKRSRTFIKQDQDNAIQIKPEQLKYFFYVDIFKDFAKNNLPYYLGNFDVIIDNNSFNEIAESFEILSTNKHPDIFANKKYTQAQIEIAKEKVESYFDRLFVKRRGNSGKQKL
jgi:hypothetical protein